MKPVDIQIWVQIVYSIVATLAILVAAVWFFWSRASAGTLQITLTLTSVTMVNNTRMIAVVRVQLKNTGRTRIKKYSCLAAGKVINVRSNSEPISIIPAGDLNLRIDEGREIFEKQNEIEPNEDTCEDVAFVLNKATVFAVSVKFKRKGTTEAWKTIAMFSADDKAKVSTPTDHSTKQTARSRSIVPSWLTHLLP